MRGYLANSTVEEETGVGLAETRVNHVHVSITH